MANRIIGYGTLLTVFGLVAYYIGANSADFDALLRISPWHLFAVAVISLFYLIVQGALYNHAVKVFKIQMTFNESLGALVLTLFGNYFFPFAGFGFRGAYLKKVHGLGIGNYAVSVIAIVLVELTMYAVFGAIATLTLFDLTNELALLLFLFFVSVAIAGAVLLVVRIPWIKGIQFLARIQRLLDQWYTYRGHRKELLYLGAFTALQFVTYCSIFWIAFACIGVQISIAEAFVHGALSDFGFVFKIAPAGAGTYEGLVVYTSKVAGRQVSDALMVLIIIRIALLLWPIVLAPFYIPKLLRRMSLRNFREAFS